MKGSQIQENIPQMTQKAVYYFEKVGFMMFYVFKNLPSRPVLPGSLGKMCLGPPNKTDGLPFFRSTENTKNSSSSSVGIGTASGS